MVKRRNLFYIGSQSTFTTPVDGRLYLMVNDDNYSDNSGSFSARIVLSRLQIEGVGETSLDVDLSIRPER